MRVPIGGDNARALADLVGMDRTCDLEAFSMVSI
jgi:hypothetical protein